MRSFEDKEQHDQGRGKTKAEKAEKPKTVFIVCTIDELKEKINAEGIPRKVLHWHCIELINVFYGISLHDQRHEERRR